MEKGYGPCMSPGRGGREPHPDRIPLLPTERLWNVTVQLVRPRDEAVLKVLMARYGVRSYSAAVRAVLREAAGVECDG